MLMTNRPWNRLLPSLLLKPLRHHSTLALSVQKATLALSGSLQKANPRLPLHNFSPGPTSLPKPVLARLSENVSDHVKNHTVSPMELSHRSPEFLAIKTNTENSLRRLFDLSDEFEILLTHGGAHAQFAAVPLNLATSSSSAHYFINGTWSARAAKEAAKYCRNVTSLGPTDGEGWWQPSSLLFEDTPAPETTGMATTPRPSYAYLCSNETVNGIEYFEFPDLSMLQVPLVVDMSSDLGSKVVDFTNIDVAFACTPKNLGIPGLTIVFVKKKWLDGSKRTAQSITPGILNWQQHVENDGLWNTPASFNIYVTGLVCEWMEENGGIVEMERRAILKSNLLYDYIDNSNGFWKTPHEDVRQRSRMNVPFRVAGMKGGDGKDGVALTEEFVTMAYEKNVVGLRTMTPFGTGEYLRASLYNSVELEAVEMLVEMMQEFQDTWI